MKLNRSLWESVNNSLCPEPDNKNFTSANFPEIGIFEQYSNDKLEEEYSKRLLEVMKTEEWPYGDRMLRFLAREMKKRLRSGKVSFNGQSNVVIVFAGLVLSISGLLFVINYSTLGFIFIAFGSSLYMVALNIRSPKPIKYSTNKESDNKPAKSESEHKSRLFFNKFFESISPTFLTASGTLALATIVQYFQQIYSGCWLTGTLSAVFFLLFVFDKLNCHDIVPRAKHLVWPLVIVCLIIGLYKSGII